MTMPSTHDPGEPLAADTAAQWFARWHSGELTRRQRRDFARWRRDHPEGAREFDRMQQLGRAAAGLSRDQVRTLLGGEIPPRPRLQRQGRLALRLAAGCAALGAAALVAWWSLPAEVPAYTATLSAERGERRQVTLPDGSMLEINGATRADVRLYAERREVALDRGEILFSVSADAARPFIVRAGSGVVRVTGTVFDVRRDEEQVAVLVASGTVEVSGGRWWNMGHAVLRAGDAIRVPGSGAIGVPAPADVQSAIAWREGRVVFKNVPLAEVVRDMNRYLSTPLRLADDKVGRLRVSASFSLDRPEALVDALPAVAPVKLTPSADGALDISAR